MTDDYRRILVFFEKQSQALALSHVDLMRAMEEAVRAAGLPVRMSEGATPKPKIGLTTALPQGMESRVESAEFAVRRGPTVREILDALTPHLPAGILAFDGAVLYPGEKWIVAEVGYEIRGEGLPDQTEVCGFLGRDRIPIDRRGRVIDLKPLLSLLERREDRLRVQIRWTDTGTARPGDVLRAFGREPESFTTQKTSAVFCSSLGDTVRKPNEEADSRQRSRAG